MPFSPADRDVLLAVKGVDATVIRQIESVGIAHLVAPVVQEACMLQSSSRQCMAAFRPNGVPRGNPSSAASIIFVTLRAQNRMQIANREMQPAICKTRQKSL